LALDAVHQEISHIPELNIPGALMGLRLAYLPARRAVQLGSGEPQNRTGKHVAKMTISKLHPRYSLDLTPASLKE
jgi:hypothetical protein